MTAAPSEALRKVSARLQPFGKKLEGQINAMAGKKMGFCLLIFDFEDGAGGRIEYLSNAQRDDMNRALAEFVMHSLKGAVDGTSNPPPSHEII